ncbi:MAG: TetR family transcriptional regulator [Ilumatobacteraceae bacterium]|nr:TetR family transcriptional regulator [Ilumatobacteraceae bacterium]
MVFVMAAPDRRRLPPELRREQLLDAAIDLAAGGDITAISVQELANRAGVSEGLLYHYFPTKQALLTAAVRRAAEAFLADQRRVAVGPPMARLGAGLGAYLDHVQAQPTGWKALLQATTSDLAEIGAEVERETMQLVLDALGIAKPSPVLLIALAGWADLERRTCLTWLERPGVPRAAIEDLLETTFFAALTSAAKHDKRTERALAKLTAPG